MAFERMMSAGDTTLIMLFSLNLLLLVFFLMLNSMATYGKRHAEDVLAQVRDGYAHSVRPAVAGFEDVPEVPVVAWRKAVTTRLEGVIANRLDLRVAPQQGSAEKVDVILPLTAVFAPDGLITDEIIFSNLRAAAGPGSQLQWKITTMQPNPNVAMMMASLAGITGQAAVMPGAEDAVIVTVEPGMSAPPRTGLQVQAVGEGAGGRVQGVEEQDYAMTTAVAQAAQTPLWSEVELPRNTPNRTAWLVTCVDLTSLLVGFFVLVFSTQTMEKDKWETITGSFQQQFAPRAAVVASVPDGANNAVVRVTGVKSGVAYLDTLLHQRLAGDPVWGDMQAVRGSGTDGQDLRYPLLNAALNADAAAWGRLGGVVRGWKNAVGIRANVAPGKTLEAAKVGYALSEKLREGGAANAFFEIVVADKTDAAPYELVVRAR